ncbi:MAG: YHYH protein [Alphaproteobacteria bacterium]|nr:YHYH protein [Alphaproteobacteria bacterium]
MGVSVLFAAAGCTDKDVGDDSAPVDSAPSAADNCAGTAYEGTVLCTAWMMGVARPAVIYTDGEDDQVNVGSVEVNGANIVVSTDGIPNYSTTITQDLLDELNSRPLAATDFVTGAPTVQVGDVVEFGEDIGYNSTGCTRGGDDEGAGYWPPGPECPEALNRSFVFPGEPAPASTACFTPIGTAGLWVNGTAIFNWTDGQTYNSEQTWYNLAQQLEVYDGGICNGHAAAGEYHHHYNPVCLADQLGDDGSGHSPLYGFMADGYPIYGPWYASGERAQSCWKKRDYSASSETGCGVEGERSCLLRDSSDISQGTVPADHNGPNTSDNVTSLSGNVFQAVSGLYFEDYYFDASCEAGGGAALDEHNGHDHDGLGYHYHVTDAFPYTGGPEYYGELATGGINCSSSPYPQGGPP